MPQRLTSFVRDCRGSAAVDFGLVMPILVVLLMGVFEFGRLFWSWNTIQFATEEAGRYAMLNPGAGDTSISDFLKGRLTGIDPASVEITMSPEVSGGVNYTVIVAKMRVSLVSLISVAPIDIQGRSRVPRVS